MSFHLFIDMSPPKALSKGRRYQYLGNYTKVPTIDPTVEVDEWLTLPIKVSAVSLSQQVFFIASLLRLLQFRSAWSLRVFGSEVRTVHVRISICNAHPQGHPPSPDEIDAWVKTNSGSHKRISMAMINNAFNSGEEVGVCLEGAIVGLIRASSPEHEVWPSEVPWIRR